MIVLKKITPLILCYANILLSTVAMGSLRQDSTLTNTLLFKITKPNSKQTSYLFGTHHAFGKPFFDTLVAANNALANCDVLIKENLNIPGEMAQDIINSRSQITQWVKLLKKEHLLFVNQLFKESPTNFNKMTPPELYAFLTRHYKQQVCIQKGDSSTHQTLDDYIATIAEENGKTLMGLEKTARQIELINKDVEGMPNKIHKKRLASIIDYLITQNPSGCGETKWYSQMKFNYKWNSPCSNTLLLTERNEKWMELILKQLPSKNCFIVVGLSHLMYNCGLVTQLQSLGYVVTPIKP